MRARHSGSQRRRKRTKLGYVRSRRSRRFFKHSFKERFCVRMFRQLPELTPAQHTVLLKRHFPSFRFTRTMRGLIWRGELKPQEDSPVYQVRIEWRGRRRPLVFIESPHIAPGAPHRYPDKSLCLYYPDDRSWTPQKHLALTIVPWTAEWLLFYELWLVTDKWFGPEAPHGRQGKHG